MRELLERKEAIGFMIMALELLGKDEKEIRRIISATHAQMDMWTETVAEEKYDKFYGI